MTNTPQMSRVDALRSMVFEDLEKGLAKVHGQLIDNPIVNRLPEHIFREYFLPCWLGKISPLNWVTEWISVAGTAASEVDIFDPKTNQILFRVPSIVMSRQLDFTKAGRGSLSAAIAHSNNLSRNMQDGKGFFQNFVDNKTRLAMSEFKSDYMDKMINIFMFYQLPLSPVMLEYQAIQNGQATNGPSSSDNSEDLFVYD